MLLGIGWTVALLALAGPVWSQLPQPVFRAESALVLVLDVSRSMDAQDVAPSRLTRAKHKILDILQTRQEGQTALVIFAGEPFVVSPLTDDARTMKNLVQPLETDLMPVRGSRPDLALRLGNELLQQAGILQGDLLLITDEDTDPATLEMITELTREGRTISILGIGTDDGAPIPEKGGFVKDESGAIVVPKLNEASLQAAVRMGHGRFARVTLDDRDINYLLPSIDDPTFSPNSSANQRTTNLWREEGPWLTVALLALVLPAFRRGWLGVILAVILLPEMSQAFSWDQLWQRPDQQGMTALEQDDPKKAATLFEQPDWKGFAHYRAGEYEQADQAFSAIDSSEAHYNRGNALAKLGKYPEAMAAYQTALTQQPDHVDAQHNLDLLKKMLENQQSPNSQENNSQSSDSSSEDQQHDGGERSGQQSQKGESEKSEQENKQEQVTYQNDTSEKETGTSESHQDSSDDSKQSEESQAQSSAQDMEENTAQSDIAQPTQGENKEETTSQEQMASASQSEEVGEDQKSQQALQQWLRRIPDDPGGLLRRKFLLEHRRRLESGIAVNQSGKTW